MVDLITISPMAKQQRIIDAVQNYGKRLFSFIRGRVRTDEDAEDILQDVWYQLSSLVDIEPIEQLSSWLFRVSRNRIIDKQRKMQTQSLEDFAFEDEEGDVFYADSLLADEMNPETEFESMFIREAFFKALEELPAKQRDVYVWNELEEMTLQQIADKTGDNIKTIISRKRYAVAFLRERLQNLYNEY
jgi:RNA polymerase sigma factor (sigma-70 family)